MRHLGKVVYPQGYRGFESLSLRQFCYDMSMNTKQKKYLVVFLIIIPIIAGLSIWLTNKSDRSDFEKEYASELDLCIIEASNYMGLSETLASDKAKKSERNYRVYSRDGKESSRFDDLQSGRLNFEIQNGVVTKVFCG